ncbi:hypothetical protein ZHAS_00005185 [Anopheles sinensis]|uniref:Uncharacterized protein n=1 Tax=Anopheles sinensis TaxID=74873 RepID=A0A084VIS5_ANOSI|nr:hypothetical protein ZHAS_00005185 [Anopheles sinensis]
MLHANVAKWNDFATRYQSAPGLQGVEPESETAILPGMILVKMIVTMMTSAAPLEFHHESQRLRDLSFGRRRPLPVWNNYVTEFFSPESTFRCQNRGAACDGTVGKTLSHPPLTFSPTW